MNLVICISANDNLVLNVLAGIFVNDSACVILCRLSVILENIGCSSQVGT